MEDPASTCPMDYFTLVPDTRASNVRHRLPDILVMALCALICDADGWSEMEEFVEVKKEWFESFLDLKHGVPSEDTFRRVLSRLDPDALEHCFMQWMAAVVEQSEGRLVAIDGKSIRRSFAHSWDKSGMAHMVSAFATHNGLSLAQLKTEGKGNELAAIKQLLGLIDLRGATISIDAIGCQKSIAKKVIQGGGNYILAVKENQKSLHQRIKVEMDDMIRSGPDGPAHDQNVQSDVGHGRIEKRRVWTTSDLSWLDETDAWEGLQSVVVVESHREIIGKTPSVERRYFITSLAADARSLARAIRSHWAIENRLHHVLDVSFHEDNSRIRKGHGAENVSRLRRIALNLLRTKGAKHVKKKRKPSIKTRRKLAGWDHQYLLNLLTT